MIVDGPKEGGGAKPVLLTRVDAKPTANLCDDAPNPPKAQPLSVASF